MKNKYDWLFENNWIVWLVIVPGILGMIFSPAVALGYVWGWNKNIFDLSLYSQIVISWACISACIWFIIYAIYIVGIAVYEKLKSKEEEKQKKTVEIVIFGALFGFLTALGYIVLTQLFESDFPLKYYIGFIIIIMIFMMGVTLGMGLDNEEKK